MTNEEQDMAVKQAINNFEVWNRETHCFAKDTRMYYEIQDIVKDAVKIGLGAARRCP